MGTAQQIKMIQNCYNRKKMRGRALYELIEKWKWPKKVPGKKSKWIGVYWNAETKKWQGGYGILPFIWLGSAYIAFVWPVFRWKAA